jgi:hypothetical protein
MGKKDVVYDFNFGSGTSSWGYSKGLDGNDRGIYNAKFSSLGAVANGRYPDHGLVEGKVPRLFYGEFLPPDMAAKLKNPITARGINARTFSKIPKDLAALTDGEFGYDPVVSGRFKAVVEAMEPNVHQFISVSFVNGVTNEPVWTNMDWYYFNVQTWVAPDKFFKIEDMSDIVSIELLTKENNPVPNMWGKKYISFDAIRHNYVIRKKHLESELSQKHIFVMSRYVAELGDSVEAIVSTQPHFFCTREMRGAFKDAGLRGGHFNEKPVV